MKAIGKLLLWIGGGALLYVDLTPLAMEVLEKFHSGSSLDVPAKEYFLQYARPLLVLGIICVAGLPEAKKTKFQVKPKASLTEGQPPASSTNSSKGWVDSSIN